jgi:hypothetical protein
MHNVGDGQRVTVPPIAELELALEGGTSHSAGTHGQRRTVRADRLLARQNGASFLMFR